MHAEGTKSLSPCISGFLSGFLVLALTGLAGCDSSSTKHSAANLEPAAPLGDSIRIGYSRLSISLPIFAAQELRLFQKNGVNPQLEMYENGQALGQALVEGKID